MIKTIGRFNIHAGIDGSPVWTWITIDGEQHITLSEEEVRDLVYGLQSVLRTIEELKGSKQ